MGESATRHARLPISPAETMTRSDWKPPGNAPTIVPFGGDAMQRVAVFGNAGGGKSTLARRLAEITGLPLYPLDLIQYTAAGEIPREQFLAAHAALLSREAWIIDGYGTTATAWERFAAADTLIY